MNNVHRCAALAMAAVLAAASSATAQVRPYIGYVYPAGGQQGTTFRVKLGGQNLDGANDVIVAGNGVSGKVVQYLRKIGPQEITLLNEQLEVLKKGVPPKTWDQLTQATQGSAGMMGSEIGMLSPEMMSRMHTDDRTSVASAVIVESLGIDANIVNLVTKIRTRLAEYVLRPSTASLASLVIGEITIAPDAAPGERELRIVGASGASNPLVFCVGQVPEASRAPMLTSEQQVLGKEALALRRLRENDAERHITVPCTVNGQIGSGEVHRYRFKARQSQRLVISAIARKLVPFIADAVPGWFQPVLALYDAEGKEVAYNDDYRFDPDPVIMFRVPKDGEYVMAINDAIYRGREDFVYRVTVGEMPFVTSIFPLGAQIGTSPSIAMKGWNLDGAHLTLPSGDARAGVYTLKATNSEGKESNSIPFALDTLPECFDAEPNNDAEHAQKVELPVIVNGRIDRPDDWDVFEFTGHAEETIVAEVKARRLGSPLDSVLKLTDAHGTLLAINDDYNDAEAGTNTHYADSYLMVKLPADGKYYLHLGDITRNGGEEYGYRLRISEPRPDFALRVVPSSVFLREGVSNNVSVYVDRKDGFTGWIKVYLKDPPTGIWPAAAFLEGRDPVAQLSIRADSDAKTGPLDLVVEGNAVAGSHKVFRKAVPAEDRMQAFLWRHLVPAKDLKGFVVDPTVSDLKARTKHDVSAAATIPIDRTTGKPKFTKAQVAGRLRELDLLFEEGLLTPEFYHERIAECGVTE
jgi:hypothetical protein